MRVGVIGAGSWGTTVANLLCDNGHDVRIWAREPEVVAAINGRHENSLFLEGYALDPALVAVADIAPAVESADLLVQAAPSHAVRAVTTAVAPVLGDARPLVMSISKGLEPTTHERVSEILGETLPGCAVVILSGPSFAVEVAQRQPTAVVAASQDVDAAVAVQNACSNAYFRVYRSTDVLGVELGGALKNVIAIAAGIAEGLGLGHNPRAALITRGLAEITRLASRLGARETTLAGLAGLGDLVLTCTGDLSRNRTVGIAIGRGRDPREVVDGMEQVVEGVRTTRAAHELGSRLGVELPITHAVYSILYEGIAPREALARLMAREPKPERWS
jgi:glycerol-3-phosphate dehydrogenase (NAD(P)+)